MSPRDRKPNPSTARQPRRQRAALWCSLTAAVAVALIAAAPAVTRAEAAITTQALADDGAFLPYAPVPSQPAGLCLVDTGVNTNPDTEGVVVDRTAIDRGTGNDVSPTLHGTIMAMMAGAPLNGWGMVGTAPRSIQIISVRILQPGQTSFPFNAYATGIDVCLQMRMRYDIKVINLSLGDTETPSSQSYEMVGNSIKEASDYGVAVVAAAGNDDGGPVEYPAAYPGVLAVGASDTQGGAFCSFSNRGEGLSMTAPGCDLDGADPISGTTDYNYWQGTSDSSDITATALTALDSYHPGLSPETAEKDLADANSGALNIAQAFRNAGLTQIVSEGEAAEPRTEVTLNPNQTTTPPSNLPMTVIATFPRPRAQLKRIKGRLLLLLGSLPSEARTQVHYLGYPHRGRRSRNLSILRTLTGKFTNLAIPTAGVIEISVRYIDPYDTQRASPWTTLRLQARTTKNKHRK